MKVPSRPLTIRLSEPYVTLLMERAQAHGRSVGQETRAIVIDVLTDKSQLVLEQLGHRIEQLCQEVREGKKFTGDVAIALLVEMGAAVEEAEEFVRRSLGQ